MGAVLDQCLASLANFVVLFAAVRSLSISDIGVLTLAYNGALALVLLVRSFGLEPLLIRHSGLIAAEGRRGSERVLGVNALAGLLGVSLGLLSFLFLEARLGQTLLLVSLTIAALLLKDAYRLYYLSIHRPWSAALNGAICLVASVAAWGVISFLAKQSGLSVGLILLIWICGASAAVLAAFLQTKLTPRPWKSISWIWDSRDLGLPFTGEMVFETLAAQAFFAVVGVVAGLGAVGEIGAALSAISPITTVAAGFGIFATAEAARIRTSGLKGLITFSAGISATVGLLVTAYAAIASTVVPTQIGVAVLGRRWFDALPLIMPMGLWAAFSGSRQGPRAILRVCGRPAWTLKLAMFSAPAHVLAGLFAGTSYGLLGAVWVVAAIYGVTLIAWWILAAKVLKEARTQEFAIVSE